MADSPTRKSPPAYSGRLHRLDSALAEDVDTLLEGSFETVKTVLTELADAAGVTPEPAAVPPQPVPEAAAVSSAHEAAPIAPVEPIPTDAADVTQDPLPPPSWAEPEPEPEAARPASATPATAAPAPPVPAVVAPDPAPGPPASEPPATPRRPVTPAFSIDPAPAAPAGPGDDGWLAEAEASWTSPAWSRDSGEARGSEPAAMTAVKIVLAIVNLPLRLVPARLRPAVDWLALSLAFWVPVVWLVVLLMTSGE